MKLAIVTKSYGPDLERCRLLCNSIDRFIPEAVNHYLVIDRRDLSLFEPLATSRRKIIVTEEILPKWLFQIPLSKRWWFSFNSLPVRGWIIQQLVKISVSEYIDSDVYLFVDSDIFFIRPLPLWLFQKNDQVRLFRVPNSGKGQRHLLWHQNAGRLLGLEPRDYYGADYIGQMITWRRDILQQMQRHLSNETGKQWQISLARTLHFSEYILYGLFSEFVLSDNSCHFFDETDLCHCSWHYQIQTPQELHHFLNDLKPEHLAILIQSNHGLDVDSYRDILKSRNLIA